MIIADVRVAANHGQAAVILTVEWPGQAISLLLKPHAAIAVASGLIDAAMQVRRKLIVQD